MTGARLRLDAVADEALASAGADRQSSIVAQRAVLVLATPERHDSRSLRIAATLAGRGHRVTILARRGPGAAASEDSPDGYRIVRVGRPPGDRGPRPRGEIARLRGELERLAGIGVALRRQQREAAAADPGADIYHGMAYQGIPIALSLRGRSGGRVLYDARDLYPESGNLARMAAPVRRLAGLAERHWARRSDRIITVNDELAAILARRFDRPLPSVVMNCLPAWTPPADRDRRFHELLGLAPETRVVLYHGGFLPSRGIEILAAAVGRLTAVALVAMGDGPLRPNLERLAAESRTDGRVHVLPPVPPADLVGWIAAADVGGMVNQPVSRNERISTPNKLFECLAAGVPVVSSDFPGRRRIVIEDPEGPLGAVCDPTDPDAVAAALREVLDRPAEAAADLRRRVLVAAHARWTWERQAATLLDVYGRLTGHPW
jgi:glycosyltransferase involved in cell wall biosynthesis